MAHSNQHRIRGTLQHTTAQYLQRKFHTAATRADAKAKVWAINLVDFRNGSRPLAPNQMIPRNLMVEKGGYDYEKADGSPASADTVITAWEPTLHDALDVFLESQSERIAPSVRERMARLVALQVARARVFKEWARIQAAVVDANTVAAGGTVPAPFGQEAQTQDLFIADVVPELADMLAGKDWLRWSVASGDGELVLADAPVVSWLGELTPEVELYRSWGNAGIQVCMPLSPSTALLIRDEPTNRDLVGTVMMSADDISTLNLLQARQAERWVIGATHELGGLVEQLNAEPQRAAQAIPKDRLQLEAARAYPRGLAP
jgi:hypothetical protein